MGPTPMAWPMKESRSSPVIRDSSVARPVVVVFFRSGRLISAGSLAEPPPAGRPKPRTFQGFDHRYAPFPVDFGPASDDTTRPPEYRDRAWQTRSQRKKQPGRP